MNCFINFQSSRSYGKMRMTSKDTSSKVFPNGLEVEEIVGVKKMRGNIMFKVKW